MGGYIFNLGDWIDSILFVVWLVAFCKNKLNRIHFIVETRIVDYYNVVTYIVQKTYIVVAYNGSIFPTGNYLFKFSNKITEQKYQISLKLTIKTLE